VAHAHIQIKIQNARKTGVIRTVPHRPRSLNPLILKDRYQQCDGKNLLTQKIEGCYKATKTIY